MTTQPPLAELKRSVHPGPLLTLGQGSPRVDEPLIGFAIEDAPPTSGTAERIGRELRLMQDVEGVLTSATLTHLELTHEGGVVRVRYNVPEGTAFDPLVGRALRVQVTSRFGPESTIDVQMRDAEDGSLLFWARDGRPPLGEVGALELSAEGGHLRVAVDGQIQRLPTGDVSVLYVGRARWDIAVLMADGVRCAFLLSRSAATAPPGP